MAETVAGWGAGPLRVHDGRPGVRRVPAARRRATGAPPPPASTCSLDRALIRRHFPYVADDTVAILHARRCGWLSGQQLGMHLLEGARRAGAELVAGRLSAVDVARRPDPRRADRRRRRVRDASPRSAWSWPRGRSCPRRPRCSASRCPCSRSGTTRSRSRTRSGAVPRDAPFLIWDDAQTLDWSAEEREALESRSGASLHARAVPGGRPHAPGGREPGEPDAPRALVLRLRADAGRVPLARAAPLPGARPPRAWRGCCRGSAATGTGCPAPSSTGATT